MEVIFIEVWKDIKKYECYYQVSNKGRIKSLARYVYNKDGTVQRFRMETIKTPIKSTDGYLMVKLCVNGINKTIGIHRLVAEAFIENPNNYPEVNHIDTNRKNNNVNNLEWCAHQSNVAHSAKLGHYKNKCKESNPNYNNHILHEIYSKNKELAKEKLSRPEKQNGRSRQVKLYDNNHEFFKSFDYIRECCIWFKSTFNITVKTETVHQHLLKSSKNQTLYYGYYITID